MNVVIASMRRQLVTTNSDLPATTPLLLLLIITAITSQPCNNEASIALSKHILDESGMFMY